MKKMIQERKHTLELLRMQAMNITPKSKILNKEADDLGIEFTVESTTWIENKKKAVDLSELLETSTTGKKKNSKENILRELYTKCRQNLRETGRSNLFLAINELKWLKEGSSSSYKAAVYLCPVEILRNNNGMFQLQVITEELFFNPALKILLMQQENFHNEKWIDCSKKTYYEQMEFLKLFVKSKKGWSIKENTAYLSLYQIPNEAIWNGLMDETVLSHEIVTSILDGTINCENEEEPEFDNSLGIYAFETDSSQNEIIASAFREKVQMIVGPAGNGKTQTIANIMLEAMRTGKKVLFVSEMVSAMEVISAKLNQILEDKFYLMITDEKNVRTKMISKIRDTLDYIKFLEYDPFQEDIEEMKVEYYECLTFIQAYYDRMKQKNDCGKSMDELLEMYAKYESCTINVELDDKCANIPLKKCEIDLGIFSKIWDETDNRKELYAEFIRYHELSDTEERELLHDIDKILETYERMLKKAWELKQKFKISDKILSEEDVLPQMVVIAKPLRKCPVFYKTIDEILRKTEEEEETQEEVNVYKEQILQELEKLSRTNPDKFGFATIYNNRRKKLEEKFESVYSPAERRTLFLNLRNNPEKTLEQIRKLDIQCDENGKMYFGNASSNNAQSEAEELKTFLKDMNLVLPHQSQDIQKVVNTVIEKIVVGKDDEIKEVCKTLTELYYEYTELQKTASEKLLKNQEQLKKYPNITKKVLFETWKKNKMYESHYNQSSYDEIVIQMKQSGYAYFLEQIEEIQKVRSITGNEIKEGFYKAWIKYHIHNIKEQFPDTDKFMLQYEIKCEQLKQYEQGIRESLKDEIVQRHLERILDETYGIGTHLEFGRLPRLFRKRDVTIREFFEETPTILQELFPCMIMTPSAVAEYIPSDFPKFDLVLIDEGSQMPVYNAFIPISKAKNCMIFGDEKQLQPVENFKKHIELEDDRSIRRDSILTAAYYVASMPRKMLRFHYRSENESLIAFSNANYYNKSIITFPSCDTDIKGVSYEFVKNGIYDKNGTKANEEEAYCVIEKIKTIYRELPEDTKKTLGIITFNIHQKNMISQFFMQMLMEDTELGRKIDELVSIVNLEACQGKEWDYVIISPGFALDKEGKFSMGFGALNKEYGMNRLNVMITRARKRMFVITSIDPYMLIHAQEQGTRKFRDFLIYAKGDMVLDSRVRNVRKNKTGIIENIATALQEQGYEVHTNIGSSAWKVDIGIVSKKNPKQYVAGILVEHFDGTKNSIHDKELIYPHNLKEKGWNIYQLRKLNWYSNSKNELKRILQMLEA